ncbi:hypothetical protein SAMN05660199_03568 [Klenkia soli]|uniref:YjbR protein n=1 Tax=Klenkia soli TaxID=1052260 RepID=A0A1H0RF93_9ACTN|nr:MmcQ/YjbR family DNA-binding protein [Klenkia soli]SDP28217.1 hypothetical protein SAMN05660199_03568 [Klenkia soli]
MATWDDVERIATALPSVEESTTWGNRCWKVAGKTFVWVRPLGKKDRADLGDAVPDGEVMAVRVDGEGGKADLLAAEPEVCFTIPHFDGFPAVLVRLDEVEPTLLAELVEDAWRVQASPKLLRDHGPRDT